MKTKKISPLHSAPTIYLTNASLSYQDQVLFTQLTLTLPAGQWTCLLGPSGVGKTSLLHLIAGLTSNASTAQPLTTSDNFPLTNRIAYMSQADSLLPWLNALDNVLIGSRLRGKKISLELRNQAIQLLKKMGIGDAMQQYPAELSGGMRQRVALARTWLENRPVILMDEPFSAVDAITRLELQTLAAELLRDRTVLLITHDPLEALRLGNHIYVLAGRPAVLTEPLQPLGATPRNPASPQLLAMQAQLLQLLSSPQ